jgi:hypothetical protein
MRQTDARYMTEGANMNVNDPREVTFTDGQDTAGTYRITRHINGVARGSITSGALRYRLQFALENWGIDERLRITVAGWIRDQNNQNKGRGGSHPRR